MNSLISDSNFEKIRERAFHIRHNYFSAMDKHLLALESALSKKNINVIWDKEKDSLIESLSQIAEKNNVTRICFDTAHDVQEKFNENYENLTVQETENSSDDLDLLVVDADFAVCSSGSLVFCDRKSKNCFNKTKNLTIIVNIDQVIVSERDLSLFLMLKYIGKETNFPKDLKIIHSKPNYVPSNMFPSDSVREEEMDVNVIFYLNNIEDLINSEGLNASLYCIGCGKCLEVCPVAAAGDQIAPIDVIKLNCFDKYNRSQHVFQHTTLCGACDNVCPVKIPLMKLLMYEMQVTNMNINQLKTKQLYSLFSKRSKLNRFNNNFLRWFFIRWFYGQNKTLTRYFNRISSDFFNVSFVPPVEDNPNEIIKDSDFE